MLGGEEERQGKAEMSLYSGTLETPAGCSEKGKNGSEKKAKSSSSMKRSEEDMDMEKTKTGDQGAHNGREVCKCASS